MTHDYKAALDAVQKLNGRTFHNSTEANEAYAMVLDSYEAEIIAALEAAANQTAPPKAGE